MIRSMTMNTGYFLMTLYASGGEPRIELGFSDSGEGYTGDIRMLDLMAAQLLEAHECALRMSECLEDDEEENGD